MNYTLDTGPNATALGRIFLFWKYEFPYLFPLVVAAILLGVFLIIGTIVRARLNSQGYDITPGKMFLYAFLAAFVFWIVASAFSAVMP